MILLRLQHKRGIFESDSLCHEGGFILVLLWPITLIFTIFVIIPFWFLSRCDKFNNSYGKY